MDKATVETICLNLTGSTQEYKNEWEADRFLVGNKLYAMIGEDPEGNPILTLECDPNRSEELRENYDGIMPGYYMNKKHWNSIYFDSNIPDELVEKLIVHSYSLILQSLPKKIQTEMS
ncbi:MAG TPA: MmcQ/YjbR family DNA-binding protein [Bacillus bacterium]|nr:MmcQ/YjbR family DNA-binding protein [Bacillus sp. (in: firmicutes)]